jgi:hypothetical protein
MSPGETVNDQRYSFEFAGDLAFRLERRMQEHGVSVRPGSRLDAIVLSILQTVESSRNPPSADNADIRSEFRVMIGMSDLAANLLSVGSAPAFATLVPHLKLLNEGSPMQNVATLFDDAANKIFELLVACWAMRAGLEVAIESPRGGRKSVNPDVLVTLEAERWGLACKVPLSSNPKSIADLIESGARQLIATPGIVRGLVVLNFRNVIEHDRYWHMVGTAGSASPPPIFSAFSSLDDAVAVVQADVEELVGRVAKEIAARGLVALATEELDIAGFLVFAHTAVGVVRTLPRLQPGFPVGDVWTGPMPTSVKVRFAAVFIEQSGGNARRIHSLADEAALSPLELLGR